MFRLHPVTLLRLLPHSAEVSLQSLSRGTLGIRDGDGQFRLLLFASSLLRPGDGGGIARRHQCVGRDTFCLADE